MIDQNKELEQFRQRVTPLMDEFMKAAAVVTIAVTAAAKAWDQLHKEMEAQGLMEYQRPEPPARTVQ